MEKGAIQIDPSGKGSLVLADPAALAPSVHEAFAAWLSDEERERANAFRSRDAATQFIVGRGLLRGALSHLLGERPDGWRLQISAYGKPSLSPCGSARDIRFSLSHTTGMVGVALAEGFDIGLDLERYDREIDVAALGELVLTASEKCNIESSSPEKRPYEFLRIWCLKEAYSKARGLGVSLPFQNFGFDLSRGSPELLTPPPGHIGPWSFFSFDSDRSHSIAVAAQARAATLHMVELTQFMDL